MPTRYRYDVFLCHATAADKPAVDTLARQLRERLDTGARRSYRSVDARLYDDAHLRNQTHECLSEPGTGEARCR